MSILKNLSVVTAGAVIVTTALSAASVQAITITTRSYDATTCGTINGCTSSQPGATTVNFDNNTAPSSGFANYTLSGTSFVNPNSGFVSGAPANDSTPYLQVNPDSTNTVTINFSNPVAYFGLYWGSIDSTVSSPLGSSLNTISFYQNGTTNLQTFNGADILAATNTNPQGDNLNRYVNFSASSSEYFNRVVLSSTGQPFESDNHAYVAAPVPFEFSPGLGILALGAWGAMAQFKSRVKKWNFYGSEFSNK